MDFGIVLLRFPSVFFNARRCTKIINSASVIPGLDQLLTDNKSLAI